MIGTFGKVVFTVSNTKIFTFQDFQRSGSAQWEEQEVIKRKPKLEFNGPGLESISFQMELMAKHGVNPRLEMEKLGAMRDTGQPAKLIIGGLPVGKYRWVIESLNESWKEIDSKGNVLSAGVNVALKEFAG